MNITEVHVKLSDASLTQIAQGRTPTDPSTPGGDPGIHGVIAYCDIVFDDSFIVDEVKLIRGAEGLHVSMPSRKVTTRNPCGHNNTFDSRYCHKCGRRIPEQAPGAPPTGRHIDICHPINASFRRHMTESIINAVNRKIAHLKNSNQPPAQPDNAHRPPG